MLVSPGQDQCHSACVLQKTVILPLKYEPSARVRHWETKLNQARRQGTYKEACKLGQEVVVLLEKEGLKADPAAEYVGPKDPS